MLRGWSPSRISVSEVPWWLKCHQQRSVSLGYKYSCFRLVFKHRSQRFVCFLMDILSMHAMPDTWQVPLLRGRAHLSHHLASEAWRKSFRVQRAEPKGPLPTKGARGGKQSLPGTPVSGMGETKCPSMEATAGLGTCM